MYGVDLPEAELNAIIAQMVAQGSLILDKLENPFDPDHRPTTAVRTPGMPKGENWYKER